MTAAKFPVYRDRHSHEFAETPVNEQQVRHLYEGSFMAEARNLVLVGHPCIARISRIAICATARVYS